MSSRRINVSVEQLATEAKQNELARVDAINATRNMLNKLQPLIAARIAKGIKFKNDGSPYAKDAKDIAAIVANAVGGEKIHVMVMYKEIPNPIRPIPSTIRIQARAHYSKISSIYNDLNGKPDVSGQSCEENAYVGVAESFEYKDKPLLSVDQVVKAKARITEIDDLISALNGERSALAHSIDL